MRLAAHERHRGPRGARSRSMSSRTTLVQTSARLVLAGSAAVPIYDLALAKLTVFPGMASTTVDFRFNSGRAYRDTRRRLAEVTGQLQEDISGVRVVQAFRREGTNDERFVEINDHYSAPPTSPRIKAFGHLLPLRRPARGAGDGRRKGIRAAPAGFHGELGPGRLSSSFIGLPVGLLRPCAGSSPSFLACLLLATRSSTTSSPCSTVSLRLPSPTRRGASRLADPRDVGVRGRPVLGYSAGSYATRRDGVLVRSAGRGPRIALVGYNSRRQVDHCEAAGPLLATRPAPSHHGLTGTTCATHPSASSFAGSSVSC